MLILSPMSEQNFEKFKIDSQNTYASDLAQTENIPHGKALEYASVQFNRLVPLGIHTEGQVFFEVKSAQSQSVVGYLWLGFQNRFDRKIASINDIKIYENSRGKGYGKQLMALVEEESTKAGATRIRLHVFQHNEIARSLYTAMGFEPTSIDMKKELMPACYNGEQKFEIPPPGDAKLQYGDPGIQVNRNTRIPERHKSKVGISDFSNL